MPKFYLMKSEFGQTTLASGSHVDLLRLQGYKIHRSFDAQTQIDAESMANEYIAKRTATKHTMMFGLMVGIISMVLWGALQFSDGRKFANYAKRTAVPPEIVADIYCKSRVTFQRGVESVMSVNDIAHLNDVCALKR